MRVILRVAIPIIIAVAIIIACVAYLAHDSSINSGEHDVLYNDIVYERVELPYNLRISEDNSKYSGGDYSEIYAYGQEVLWEIFVLNDEENVLYSAVYVWVKPGYELPGDFGEELASVDYVVSEGVDFLVMRDGYTEEVTHLANLDGNVKLENIVASEPTEISEFTERGTIRFMYKNYKDMSLDLDLCESDGGYYLNVKQGSEGTDAFFLINAEYLALLTSALPSAE